MKYLVAFLILILPAGLLPPAGQAVDFQSCKNCHGEDLYKDNTQIYLHSPYAQQLCGKCHTAGSVVSGQEAATATVASVSPQKQAAINWLGDSVMADTSHAFLLPSDKVGETLVVDLQGADGKLSRREIAVPPLAGLGQIQDPGRPPVLSAVRVLKVQRGVFLSATIGWQTDSLADSMVYYGIKNLSQSSEPSNRLGERHEVVLYNLKPDQTYRFSVVSAGFFGRSQASDPLEFSTSNPFLAPLPDASATFVESGSTVGMTSSFRRVGTDYLLELTLEQPAAVYVGSKGEVRPQVVSSESSTSTMTSAAVAGGGDVSHLGLSSEAVSSMGACRNCHQDQNTATHPVNVYPKPGMIIPPEYPTLPDGRITCSTCHAPHGSNYEYLARKQSKRELCVGCHKDML